LFPEYDFCLNLGGFSNVSFEEKEQRIAFDISPVNTVLNYYANQLGLEYDDKGKIARTGKLNQELLNELNSLVYYRKSYPKSLGFEFVKKIVLTLMEKYTVSNEDKMNTFIEHIAIQTDFSIPKKEGKLLITGGGAYNDFLIEKMQKYLPKMKLIIPDSKTLEYKEALIFGLLGVLKLRNEINVLCSVTGAKKNHSSGFIYVLAKCK
jgi:anhydro-N-acetylmuramic acid kinase